MIKYRKNFYFIFLFFATSLSYGDTHGDRSIKLEGVENDQTYSSPIKLNFIVENMKVRPAGVMEENSGHHHLLINLHTAFQRNGPKFRSAAFRYSGAERY